MACATSPRTKIARCNNNSPIVSTTAAQIKNTAPCQDNDATGGLTGPATAGSIVGVVGAIADVSLPASIRGGSIIGETIAGAVSTGSVVVSVPSTYASWSPKKYPKLKGAESEVGRISFTSTSIHIQ
ncbi:MAG TPA: hypothetical protein VMW72_14315 [Sedimentisphaerales bacterium]|nr:hypothetical protein [Sedimentisphaerales bacterium]